MNDIVKIETIAQLCDGLNQGKPKHPQLCLVDFSKVDFKPIINKKITCSFYVVINKKLNSGILKYGRNEYDYQYGSLFFLAPNQIVQLEDPCLKEAVYGWGLYFHPDLMKGTTLQDKMKEYHFFSYDATEALHLSQDEMGKLTRIIDDIRTELEQCTDKHSKTLIVSAIELLLNYCNRYYDRQFVTRSVANKGIATDFEKLLLNYFCVNEVGEGSLPSVKCLAEQLNLSPNYLSDLLKKETGKNASEHIQYHLIEHAKAKLLSTSHSINEIAYNLGFEYPQYFSRLFKKNTGMTPVEFRKKTEIKTS